MHVCAACNKSLVTQIFCTILQKVLMDTLCTAYHVHWLTWSVSSQMQGRLWAEEGRSGSVHAAMVDAAMRLHEGVKSKHSDLEFFLQNSPGQRREASHF